MPSNKLWFTGLHIVTQKRTISTLYYCKKMLGNHTGLYKRPSLYRAVYILTLVALPSRIYTLLYLRDQGNGNLVFFYFEFRNVSKALYRYRYFARA